MQGWPNLTTIHWPARWLGEEMPRNMTDSTVPRTLLLEPWRAQEARWPRRGRHVLAQFDDQTIVVYQAYNSAISNFAVEHRRLVGAPGFGLGRMSWVKPNFLWMMYRSGWATNPGQERILAIRLERTVFERILAAAAWTRFEPAIHESREAWRAGVGGFTGAAAVGSGPRAGRQCAPAARHPARPIRRRPVGIRLDCDRRSPGRLWARRPRACRRTA